MGDNTANVPLQKLPTARMTGESWRARRFLFLALKWGSCSHAGGKLQTIQCWNLNQLLFFPFPCVLLMITSKYPTCVFVTRGLCLCRFVLFFVLTPAWITLQVDEEKGRWARLFSSFGEKKNVNKKSWLVDLYLLCRPKGLVQFIYFGHIHFPAKS